MYPAYWKQQNRQYDTEVLIRDFILNVIIVKVIESSTTNKTSESYSPVSSSNVSVETPALNHSLGSEVKEKVNYIKCALINARGFWSKEASIRNLLVERALQVLLITETQCVENEFPKVDGYFTYFRNRKKRKGGGIAILVAEDLKGRSKLVEVGKDQCEMLSVQIECPESSVTLICYYGQQENTTEKEVIDDHIAQVVASATSDHNDGNVVVVAGDFNLKTGNALTSNKNRTMSRGGKVLVDMLDETDLICMNDFDVNKTGYTHVDRSSNTSNVLDLLFTNEPSVVGKVNIDGTFKDAPSYTRKRGKVTEAAYTDHTVIGWDIKVKTVTEDSKAKPKIKKWRYRKEGGAERYRQLLEEQSDKLMEAVVNMNTTDAAAMVVNEVERVKKIAYGFSKITSKKLEKIEERKLWEKRRCELESFVKKAKDQPGKDMHKLFFVRKDALMKLRYEAPSAITNLETGELLTKKVDINKYALEYNEKLLTKHDPPDEWKEERARKENFLNEMMEMEDEESRRPITKYEYEQCVFEIIDGKKDCYLDFVRSGPQFKMVVFGLIQKIYLTGEVPESFKRTTLMKLYKKGDQKLLSNYRFLHLKHWLPKITEKVVMKRLIVKMNEATPDLQLGNRSSSSCVEHLVTLATVLQVREKEKKATAITFMDVQKCFDQVHLKDVGYEAAKAGVKGKPLKTLIEINSDTVMNIAGDESEETFVARNTVGQGLVSACVGSGLAMGTAVERAFNTKLDVIDVFGVKVHPRAFVDDVGTPDHNPAAVRETGERLSRALDSLGLKAHPTKSVRITSGPAAGKKKMIKDLEENPQKIQGSIIKEAEEEKYLGLVFGNKNHRQNLNRNIEVKRAKIIAKTKTIKRLLNNPAILKMGWMRAAVGFIQSIIVSTQMYGVEAFINMTKQNVKDFERIQKDAIYDILGISKYANYSAVLAEIGVLRAEDTVKLRKVSFVNGLMHNRKSCECREVITAAEQSANYDGLLQEVRQYCEEFRLPDVSVNQLLKRDIDNTIKKKSVMENWLKLKSSRKVEMRMRPEKTSDREYFKYNRLESKLMLALQIGELNFLENRKKTSIKEHGSTMCYVKVCGGNDNLKHVKECFGYESKPPKAGASEKEMANYLVELNKERNRKYQSPLVLIRN